MLPHRKNVRKQADQEQALSEVIGFVLILGLIVIFIALWMTYVVPAEGRETEIRHMNDVRDWFTQYKITLDSLWINNGDDTLTGQTISNSLTLGSQGGATQAGGFYLPLMKPIGSTGGLAVANYGERIRIRVNAIERANMTLGALEFETSNNYWIPQTFYYQMGGVFLMQEGGTVVRVAPLVGLTNYTDGSIGVRITPATIAGSGQSSISGQGPVRVDTRLNTASGSASYTGSNVSVMLTLRDDRSALAWENALREIRFSRGIPASSCIISRSANVVTMDVVASPVRVTIIPANYTVSLQSIATGVA